MQLINVLILFDTEMHRWSSFYRKRSTYKIYVWRPRPICRV